MSKRMYDYVSFIPFGIAISAFLLYLRYAMPIKLHEKIAVTGLLLGYANRFRNIAIFSCLVGIVIYIITSLIYYSTGNQEYISYKPTMLDIKLMLIKAKANISKAVNLITILLCIILILLLGIQINKQSNINKQNMNIKTVELFN
ncbi:MAG: hypothetical protein IKE10_00075 [Bacilli bacterium]|nr:hypothetical protein [Bacilli bacterium]